MIKKFSLLIAAAAVLSALTISAGEIPKTTGAISGINTENSAIQGSSDSLQEFNDVHYVLYLGTNDKDTNEPVFEKEECIDKAREILIKHLGGYTIQEAFGGWADGDTVYEEYTLIIHISDATPDQVHAVAEELREEFNQTAVLIETNPTVTEYYYGAEDTAEAAEAA